MSTDRLGALSKSPATEAGLLAVSALNHYRTHRGHDPIVKRLLDDVDALREAVHYAYPAIDMERVPESARDIIWQVRND